MVPFGLVTLTYNATLEQKNPCIRSQLGSSSLNWKVGIPIPTGPNIETTVEDETAMSFPYPTAFRKLLKSPPQRRVLETININGGDYIASGFWFPYTGLSSHLKFWASGLSYKATTCPIPDEENRNCDFADNSLSTRQEPPAQEEDGSRGITHQQWGISYPLFSFTRTSAIEREIKIQPTYVVLGIFSRGHHNPQERVVFVSNPYVLFRELRWGVFRLRGLSSAFLSLRQVNSFRLYRASTSWQRIFRTFLTRYSATIKREPMNVFILTTMGPRICRSFCICIRAGLSLTILHWLGRTGSTRR